MEVRFLIRRSERYLDQNLEMYFRSAISALQASGGNNAIEWISFFSHLTGIENAMIEKSSALLMYNNPNYPYDKAVEDFQSARVYIRNLIKDSHKGSDISAKEALLLYSLEKFKNLLDE